MYLDTDPPQPVRASGKQPHLVKGQVLGPEQGCLGPAVVCGFLASCKKDFTARGQVPTRIHLLKLGAVKQGRT